MSRGWDRRDFLKLAAGSMAGVGLAPFGSRIGSSLSPTGERGTSPRRTVRPEGLPPRTVGLRTLGGDFRFDPVGLRIEKGDRLVWLNVGDFHTASAFHPDNAKLLPGEVPLRIPREAESFHSGMLGLTGGTQFEWEFPVEGVYDYFCQPHYSFGMVGRLIVGAPGDGPAVTRPISELNEASREQMPSIERIMGPVGRIYEWSARLNGLLYLRANGEPLSQATAAVAEGLRGDGEIAELLEDTGRKAEFDRKLTSVLEGFGGDTGYEKMVARVDAVKDVLRAAHETG